MHNNVAVQSYSHALIMYWLSAEQLPPTEWIIIPRNANCKYFVSAHFIFQNGSDSNPLHHKEAEGPPVQIEPVDLSLQARGKFISHWIVTSIYSVKHR